MRTILLTALFASALFAQTGKFGAFTDAGDVGNPAIKGSTEYDAATGQYKLTGAGVNMWAKEDQFQYVYREMSGDFAVTATLQFLGEGAMHRKAGIVVRKTLDNDSPYVDLVIHGNGMPGIQWRTTKGDITNGFDLAFDSPGKFQIKLVRHGAAVTTWMGKDGAPMKEIGTTQVALGNPVHVGLGVCSHQPDHSDTVVFSDVSVQAMAAAAPAKKKK
jgi:regulation of enolase protein 1 (concanavalin A-like superfamily)